MIGRPRHAPRAAAEAAIRHGRMRSRKDRGRPSASPTPGACLPGCSSPSGFSLVEVLVALAISMALLAALLGAAADAQRTALVQPEMADLAQRLRSGTAALLADLQRAGAGAPVGCAPGPLHRYFAPVRPYRIGFDGAQPPGTFDPHVISVVAAPSGAAVAALAAPVATPSATASIAATAGSALASPSLGFAAGMSVAIIDPDGVTDFFRVTATGPSVLALMLLGGALDGAHAAGACVVEVDLVSYRLAPDAASGGSTLNRYDGYRSDLPVADHIVGLSFSYFGEPRAASLVGDPGDPTGPWTHYGPRPPPLGHDNPRDSWPAGENCVFTAGAAGHGPRMAPLGAADAGLVPLDAGVLSDGPWCHDAGRPLAFDADLLRIRRVTVTLRVESPTPFLRGPAGTLFARAGSGSAGALFVPDRTVSIDIAPRNLGADR